MCNPIAIARPADVLARGTHAGFEWEVIHNQMGFRCGYMRVPIGHPWHGKAYADIGGAEVHGGLTFAAPDKDCGKGGADDGHWIGFDCAHGGDAPDPDLPVMHARMLMWPGIVRTQEYVEAECKSLCEQAAAAAKETEQ